VQPMTWAQPEQAVPEMQEKPNVMSNENRGTDPFCDTMPDLRQPSSFKREPMLHTRNVPMTYGTENEPPMCSVDPYSEKSGVLQSENPDMEAEQTQPWNAASEMGDMAKEKNANILDQSENVEPNERVMLSVRGPYANQWRWRNIIAKEMDYSYLMGEVEQDGKIIAVAVAVPGEYAPSPPVHLQGFQVYRDGYWILAQDAETGAIIDI